MADWYTYANQPFMKIKRRITIMGFDNYGRWLYNRSLEVIPNSVFGMKKKDYSHLLSSVEDKKKLINEKLYKMASYTGRRTNFAVTHDAIDLTAHYDSILHFYYSALNIDWTIFDYINDVKITDVPELTIEMPTGDGDIWFVHVKPFMDGIPLTYKDKYKWAENGLVASVYLNNAKEFSANCMYSKYKDVTPIFGLAILKDEYHISVGPAYKFDASLVKLSKNSTLGIYNLIDLDSDKPVNAYFVRMSYKIIYAIMYCVHCYNHRDTIQKAGSVEHKIYKEHAVHVVRSSTDNEKAEITDKLVNLNAYHVTGEYTYKGGHHSSPIEHDRKGFYRKSRGRGDYNLVDGFYIFVGNKQGAYSYVRATHVNGTKPASKTVKVYNVK
jgi:hypothetical protein